MEHTIDATNQILGRTASKAATLLMGKGVPGFARNSVTAVKVVITNASKLKIDQKKFLNKKYISYTGYPGGLNTKSMAHKTTKKGYSEVLRLAVYGMLPSNKLRPKMMKNLIISE